MKALAFSFSVVLLFCSQAQSQTGMGARQQFRNFVTNLPAVDRIEILEVSLVQTDDPTSVDCTKSDVICAPGRAPLKIEGMKPHSTEMVSKVSETWRKLKIRNEKSCFNPTHVLRFYQGTNLVLVAQVSFFGPMISLPDGSLINISGDMGTFYLWQDLIIPNAVLDARSEEFKKAMLPQVDKKQTLIGVLSGGKLGSLLSYKQWEVWIYSLARSDPNKRHLELYELRCHTVKVTGTLRYSPGSPRSPQPVPPTANAMVPARLPEHFYFDLAEITVEDLSKPVKKIRRRADQKQRK